MSCKLLQDLPQQQTQKLVVFLPGTVPALAPAVAGAPSTSLSLQGCSMPESELKYSLNYHHPSFH